MDVNMWWKFEYWMEEEEGEEPIAYAAIAKSWIEVLGLFTKLIASDNCAGCTVTCMVDNHPYTSHPEVLKYDPRV